MDINAAFPSNWLKAADLNGRTVKATIREVVMEEVGDGEKPVVYFEKAEKGLVLNKTNAQNIADAYGADTEGWEGMAVEIYPDKTSFQGRRVDCIRVRPVQGNGAARPTVPATGPKDLDDEIPF